MIDPKTALAEAKKTETLMLHVLRHTKDVKTLESIYVILGQLADAARNALKRAKMPEKWCWHCESCGFERDSTGHKRCFECGGRMVLKEIK